VNVVAIYRRRAVPFIDQFQRSERHVNDLNHNKTRLHFARNTCVSTLAHETQPTHRSEEIVSQKGESRSIGKDEHPESGMHEDHFLRWDRIGKMWHFWWICVETHACRVTESVAKIYFKTRKYSSAARATL